MLCVAQQASFQHDFLFENGIPFSRTNGSSKSFPIVTVQAVNCITALQFLLYKKAVSPLTDLALVLSAQCSVGPNCVL